MRRALELARWVGEGREITATEVLRPQVGRAACRELGLVETSRTVWSTPES